MKSKKGQFRIPVIGGLDVFSGLLAVLGVYAYFNGQQSLGVLLIGFAILKQLSRR